MTHEEAIAVLFRAASKSAHPDAGGSNQAMAKVNDAVDTLRHGPKPATRSSACDKPHCVDPAKVAWDLVINFGKHRGTRWAEVPLSYLAWLVENSYNPTSKTMALRWLHIRVTQ